MTSEEGEDRSKIDDLDKYVLDQAKTEVEHTRSWPTKILAFYVAINFAVVTALPSFALGACQSFLAKALITILLLVLGYWAVGLLRRNHVSYLQNRNIQISFQTSRKEELQRRYAELPQEWFQKNTVGLRTRAHGWGFYAFIVAIVTALTLAGVWLR